MKYLFYTILIIACITACNKNEDKNAQVETRSATGVTNAEATCWGKITEQGSNGIKEYGIEIDSYLGTEKFPHTITKSDSFGVQFNELSQGVIYSYRAYVIENSDNIKYGNFNEFTTLTPVEFSVYVRNTTGQTADIQFTNTEQLREWGLYYSTTDPATTEDTKKDSKGDQVVKLTGLEPYTYYYVLAYAIGKNGTSATFNNGFYTATVQPELSTPVSSNITISGATISFGIDYFGGKQAVIDDCGVQYSTNGQIWTKKKTTYAEGPLSCTLTGLTPATKYYIQAYARNNGAMEGYSETIEITTLGSVPSLANPSITTLKSFKIMITGGKVTNDNLLSITEYGFCWSTTKGQAIANGTNYVKITTGSKDAFEYLSLYDFIPGTKYYICTYAKNQVGTGYSEEIIMDVPNPQYGEFTDKRDGKKYKTVIIGDQEWMAEDLNFDYIWSYIDGTTNKRVYTIPYQYPYSITDIVSPEGWHIPTEIEVEAMIAEIGGANNNSPIAKTGRNTTGLGIDKYFWTSTSKNNSGLMIICSYFLNGKAISKEYVYTGSNDTYYPVRCIKNK